MTGEKNKQVSRLFLSGAGRKKSGSGRTGPAGGLPSESLPLQIGLLVIVALTVVLLILPFSNPEEVLLTIGDITPRDVKATRDLMVLDRNATRDKREAAVRDSPTVFDLDDQAAQRVSEQVHRLFTRGRAILQAPLVNRPVFKSPDEVDRPSRIELDQLKKEFDSVFSLNPKAESFTAMAANGFSIAVERTLLQLVVELFNRGIVVDPAIMAGRPGTDILIRRVYSQHESAASYPYTFTSLEEARRVVGDRAVLYSSDFEPPQLRAVVNMARGLLHPNLTINRMETEDRRQAARAAVTPVFFRVKQGEMIVREGERVDELARLKLEVQARVGGSRNWLSKAGGAFILVLLLLGLCYVVRRRIESQAGLKTRDLTFLASLMIINLVLVFLAARVGDALVRAWPNLDPATVLFLAPVAAGGMLAAIFLGPNPAVFFSVVTAALAGLIVDRSLEVFCYYFLGALVGLAGLVRVREHGALIKSGLLVSLVNLAVITSLKMLDQTLLTQAALVSFGAGFLGGILAGVMVSGLVPLFEIIFGYTTNLRLLELANLDRPVLRELMVQAPGTYHHSVIVGAMVEAAAEAIGANPLLAKVSAYYHDLGKMTKPLYFVENQGGGLNRHEKLAPSMSSLILISHVKEGIELARQHKISPQIIDIIQQHHGTSLIAYFFQKAQDCRTETQPEINIEDYRYPGPKPQTREAGLVMLADSVEAASRTLAEPTPARIQGMVQKIVNNKFSDGQLDECELTLKDLHLIARSFNQILTGIFHRRIDYPEPAAKESASKGKAANGHQSKQSPKDPPDKPSPDKGPGKEDLKRLGIS
ncbi:MAG: HDIG domain-containing protein [Proteobacteria bacterium]|nr:HDIG domain-containing protein [Pseudomonadota bacterium]